jgi:hypothetical protein
MAARDKQPVPQKDPPAQKPPITDPPADPDKGHVEVDVDDAMIEPPRDQVFEKEADQNNTTNRIKERNKAGKDLEKHHLR